MFVTVVDELNQKYAQFNLHSMLQYDESHCNSSSKTIFQQIVLLKMLPNSNNKYKSYLKIILFLPREPNLSEES